MIFEKCVETRQKMRVGDLDDRDRAILHAWMADGRLSNVDLAERVNLSPSAGHLGKED